MSDATGGASLDPRTRLLLEAPIVPTLLRLGAPNVLIMLAQTAVGLIETYFVGKLGTNALAGMALVFPVVMLMQMMSAGAFGGAIASSIARTLGAGRRAEADALVLHSLLIALAFGLLYTAAALGGGRWLYRQMGGTDGALEAAMTYSNLVFAGAALVWIYNALSAVIRGSGNMAVPAIVTCAGVVALIPLSPLLIFGWGPVPALGIAGGAVALLANYLLGSIALALYLWSRNSLLRPSFAGLRLRWPLFRDILRVGLVGAISTIATNLAIAIATALAGGFGTAAIAGYGTAARLEYLLVPLVFGLGSPLVTIVGTCIGAGQRERALRATWIGAGLAVAMTEAIGLWAAVFPHAWLSLFDRDQAMLEAGTLYLHAVGPLYGFFGLGLILYFASQGAGRLLWPVLGNLARLVVAASGGWLALQWGGGLTQVFIAQGVALAVYGTINAAAMMGGAWFGPVGWPRSTAALLRRVQQA
ncbi:MAG: MATE family efflux transporter [Burkholderiales bacterium]